MDINIYGTLNAQTTEGVAARATQIKDVALGKMQSELNQEFAGNNNVSFSVTGEKLTITVSG